MRTLIIFLCFLLMLAPAHGQHAVRQSQPNFYVPYGVRSLPVAPIEESSSSDGQPYLVPMEMPNPPMAGRYPMRVPRGRRYGARYGMNPQPEFTTAEALVSLGVVALVFVGWAISGQ